MLVVVGAGPTSAAEVGQSTALLTRNVLGRSDDCALCVQDQFASRRHASIEFINGVYVLTDLNSKNGTLLNGERVLVPAELLPGDRIEIGSTVFEFRA